MSAGVMDRDPEKAHLDASDGMVWDKRDFSYFKRRDKAKRPVVLIFSRGIDTEYVGLVTQNHAAACKYQEGYKTVYKASIYDSQVYATYKSMLLGEFVLVKVPRKHFETVIMRMSPSEKVRHCICRHPYPFLLGYCKEKEKIKISNDQARYFASVLEMEFHKDS